MRRLLGLQEDCRRACYSRDQRRQLIEANWQLEVARHLVRLAHALKLFGNHTYGVLVGKLAEVGRMMGGWLKSVLSVRATPEAVAGRPRWQTGRGAAFTPHQRRTGRRPSESVMSVVS